MIPRRLLGVDVGTRYIGLSKSIDGMLALPLEPLVVNRSRNAIKELAAIAKDEEADAVIVGLPLLLSGMSGKAAVRARNWATQLKEATCAKVIMWDERLSTAEARKNLRESGVPKNKVHSKIDSAAAVVILDSYVAYLEHGK